jgi:predicted dinucleotide-utilizing enzyme
MIMLDGECSSALWKHPHNVNIAAVPTALPLLRRTLLLAVVVVVNVTSLVVACSSASYSSVYPYPPSRFIE